MEMKNINSINMQQLKIALISKCYKYIAKIVIAAISKNNYNYSSYVLSFEHHFYPQLQLVTYSH